MLFLKGTAAGSSSTRLSHLAHGTFGFEPEDNFLVTGAKTAGENGEGNETLTISPLDELIRMVKEPT